MTHQQPAPSKEIGVQAIGGAAATLIVLSVSWITGTQPPAGLEGALAVLAGAVLMTVRKWLQERKNETDPEL